MLTDVTPYQYPKTLKMPSITLYYLQSNAHTHTHTVLIHYTQQMLLSILKSLV